MCGISLIISKLDEAICEEKIRGMNDRVKHRGPDGEGYYFGSNFAMGHRRLSIVDLSPAGLQPMRRGDDYIIFNGMIYNYLELRTELVLQGYEFSTQTDTEVLLAACQHWGTEAFKRLNGMWAFAWYNRKSNQIILCRDHFGIKPMYYTTVNNLFAVASEIKQFLNLPGYTPVLNKKVAVNFLTHGWLNYSEHTFFMGTKELRAGHYLVYDLENHHHQIHNWYNLSEASAPVNPELQKAILQVRDLFGDSIKKRMRADVSIGSCLSGGIDSSAIVSHLGARQLANKNFVTVTSCYRIPKYDEQIYSDEVTRSTGFKGVKVFPELNRLFDDDEMDIMLYHQEQPFGTASHYSEFQVFKTAAAQKLKVMLDGQGADEYFGGYDEFFMIYLHALIRSGKFREAIRSLKGKADNNLFSIGRLLISYYKTIYWYPRVGALKKIFGKPNFSWLNNSWKKIAGQNLVAFKPGNLRDLSLQEMISSSLPLQLHSEDRNSMMHSIESRLPYLDHRLVEYVISLPCGFKIKDGISKFILRNAIDELPLLIKNRTDKMGFVAPDEPWVRQNKDKIRTELKDAIDNTDIFSNELLKRFDRFIAGKLNYEPIYIRAITLNRFIRIFKMQSQTNNTTDNKPLVPKMVVRQDLVQAIVTCSNLLADVNYC
jgi:asparagine synthase (glutamine-hydrolysing)